MGRGSIFRNLSSNKLSNRGESKAPGDVLQEQNGGGVESRRGSMLHEKLHVNIETDTLSKAPKGVSPSSTRRANLQSFIFGNTKKKSEEAVEVVADVPEVESVEEIAGEVSREHERVEMGRLREEETLAQKQAKLSALAVLQEEKRTLQTEVAALGKELLELQSEFDREDDLGTKKQLQLRAELDRLKRGAS